MKMDRSLGADTMNLDAFIRYFETLRSYVMHNHEELDEDRIEEKSFAEGYASALYDVIEYLKVSKEQP